MSSANSPKSFLRWMAALFIVHAAPAVAANIVPYDAEIAAQTRNKPAPAGVQVIPHGIEAGQRVDFDTSVIIEGDIGEHAVVRVSNGGIEIKGKVGDSAVIHANGPAVDIRSEQGGSRTHVQVSGGNNIVIINGKQIRMPESLSGITVHGSIGRECQFATDGSIVAGDVGPKALLTATNAIGVKAVRAGAVLQADNGITATNVGTDAHLVAGNSVKVGDVAARVRIEAGNSVTADTIAPGAYVKAGNSINAHAADQADLHARNSVNIR